MGRSTWLVVIAFVLVALALTSTAGSSRVEKSFINNLCSPSYVGVGQGDPVVSEGDEALRMLRGMDAGTIRGSRPQLVRGEGRIGNVKLGAIGPTYCCQPPDGGLRCAFYEAPEGSERCPATRPPCECHGYRQQPRYRCQLGNGGTGQWECSCEVPG